jgi:DNA polymerase-4
MGVETGMTLRQARALCPQAHFVSADRARYQAIFDQLLEILMGFTPYVEPGDLLPSAISWLDLGHLERGQAVEVAQRMGQVLREEIGLAPAIGLNGGKFPAYAAAASLAPNKALIIAPGREAAFLGPFPIDLLPQDGETARWLRLLGIRTLGQLAALPPDAVLAQFGAKGQLLHQLARGCDERPVRPYRSQAKQGVSRQLDGPVADGAILEALVRTMVMELAARLQGLVGRELRLRLHLEDGTAHQERLVMRQPSGDPERLARIAGGLIGRVEIGRGVTELEVILAGLVPARGKQLDLFVHRTGQTRRLGEVLKDLVARYGADSFYRVSLINREAHLPERRFQLWEVDAH